GNEIIGSASALAQGQTLIPLTAGRLRAVTRDLLSAALRQPSAPRVTRPDEFWVVDAIEGWYATRIAWEAFGYSREEVLRELAGRYLEATVNPTFDGSLTRLYRGKGAGRAGRDLVAPTTLGLIDDELRRSSAGKDSLEARLHRFFASSRAPSLWSLLPRQPFYARLRDSVVTGEQPLPVDRVWALEPFRPSPDVAPGPPGQWLDLAYTGRTDGFLENC